MMRAEEKRRIREYKECSEHVGNLIRSLPCESRRLYYESSCTLIVTSLVCFVSTDRFSSSICTASQLHDLSNTWQLTIMGTFQLSLNSLHAAPVTL